MSSETDERLVDAAFEVLERVLNDRKRLKTLIRRARTRDARGGSAVPDGFGRGTGYDGGSSGGPRLTVEEDEHGPEETVEFTAVELAALRRLAELVEDDLRKTVRNIETTLKGLADHGGRLLGLADRIETLNIDPETLNRPKCYLCPKLTLDAKELTTAGAMYRVDVNGTPFGVCRWAYENVTTRRRAIERGAPGFIDALERLPNRDEVNLHHDGRNVRLLP